jgi:hypothetical protein
MLQQCQCKQHLKCTDHPWDIILHGLELIKLIPKSDSLLPYKFRARMQNLTNKNSTGDLQNFPAYFKEAKN